MKKLAIFCLLPMLLVSCDHFGTSSVKNLIDLTPRLEVESNDSLNIKDGKQNLFIQKKAKSYKLSKHPIIAKPVVAKGVMYSVDNKGYVSAFSLKEKKILWTRDLAKGDADRNYSAGGMLFSDDRLYITNSSKYLITLDAKTGRENLRKLFPDILRTKPIMVNDRTLIVQTINNQLIAYDIKAAKMLWINEGGLEIISTKNHVHPIMHNNHVLVSFTSGEILYVDIKTGQAKWKYNITNSDDVGLPSFEPSVIVTLPIISNNYAYFATSNGKIIKLDLDNGAAAWIKNAKDVHSMSLIADNIFITNNARQIAALSNHNGKVKWVGELISEKDRASKKPKTTLFQDSFITKENNNFIINVIAANGEMYQFYSDQSGNFSTKPTIVKIKQGVIYHWISCCSDNIHLISDYQITY